GSVPRARSSCPSCGLGDEVDRQLEGQTCPNYAYYPLPYLFIFYFNLLMPMPKKRQQHIRLMLKSPSRPYAHLWRGTVWLPASRCWTLMSSNMSSQSPFPICWFAHRESARAVMVDMAPQRRCVFAARIRDKQ